jgi:hypothetical protein
MSYVEQRVRVKNYGSLPRSSPLLVRVPGVGGPRLLHVLAAAAFERLRTAAMADIEVDVLLASGWRKRRWATFAAYEAEVVRRFGSLAEGRRWLAYASPHETGLAMDIGSGGLRPTRSTVKRQRKTALHQWLVERAHEFGFHPYKVEPWHWEFPLSFAAWKLGEVEAFAAWESGEVEADDDDSDVLEEADDDGGPDA